MRYLKGLAVAAIAVIPFFAGVNPVAATTLCTVPGCSGEQSYGVGTEIDLSLASGTSTSTTSGSNTIATCTGSTLKGKTSNASGTKIALAIESLVWSGCSQTIHTVAKGKLEFHWIAGTGNATVVGQQTQWTTNLFGVSCTYGTAEGAHLGTVAGGESSLLTVAATFPKTAGGFLCPSVVGFDGTYVITSPHALYFAA